VILFDILAGGVTCGAAHLARDETRRRKSTAKIRNSALLRGRYTGWLLFKAYRALDAAAVRHEPHHRRTITRVFHRLAYIFS